jgi:hypothetical protein
MDAGNSSTNPSEKKQSRVSYTIELTAAVLLALATIGSAWSGYQSALWSGLQTIRFSESAAMRTKSGLAQNVASRKLSIDVDLFLRFLEQRRVGDSAAAQFLFERFRPTLRKATTEWLQRDPLSSSDAPKSPFEMGEYELPEFAQVDSLLVTADFRAESAKQANRNSDNYVLLTVLFASVLFFAGVGTKFKSTHLSAIMLGFGGVIFLAAVVILIIFPRA